jgi:hypothetical protein
MRGLKATALSLVGREDLAARRKSAPLSIAQSGLILLLPRFSLPAIPNPSPNWSLTLLAKRREHRKLHCSYPASITTPSLSPTRARRRSNCTIDRQHNIYFTLPQTHVVRTATIHVYYAFSPALIPQLSHLKLIMNGTLFATIQPTPGKSAAPMAATPRPTSHSPRAAGPQQRADHRVHRPLHHELRRPRQLRALGAR